MILFECEIITSKLILFTVFHLALVLIPRMVGHYTSGSCVALPLGYSFPSEDEQSLDTSQLPPSQPHTPCPKFHVVL